jgi:hypothetical protein
MKNSNSLPLVKEQLKITQLELQQLENEKKSSGSQTNAITLV